MKWLAYLLILACIAVGLEYFGIYDLPYVDIPTRSSKQEAVQSSPFDGGNTGRRRMEQAVEETLDTRN